MGFFRGSGTGIVFDLTRKDVVRLELSVTALCVHHHVNDDCVYLGCSNGIYQFEAGNHLAYRWRSKPFFTSALTGLNCLRVEGEQTSGNPVQVKVFGPDRGFSGRERVRCAVNNTRTRRISTRRSEKEWAVELSGTAAVYEVRVGSSVEDLEHGN